MDVKPQFVEFLKTIRLTENQKKDLITGHKTLRDRLREDERIAPILVNDFLQGSYRRSTAVRPKGDKRADVDIVVVTNLDEQAYTPQQVMDLFKPFLDDYYKGKWHFQGRSIGIELSYVDLDIVPTSAPSEAAREAVASKNIQENLSFDDFDTLIIEQKDMIEPKWKESPLRIPDREAECWEDTNPLAQIAKTWEKNKTTKGLYINVVKALKWWRRINTEPKYPKGYPLEHLIYLNCPDTIETIAEGVTLSLENIVANYSLSIDKKDVPFIPDHGVSQHNVLGRLSYEDFEKFYLLICEAAKLSRSALEAPTIRESCNKWRELFGQFPEPPTDDENNKGGYTPPTGPPTHRTERFA